MSFRSRLLIAFGAAVLAPLALLAIGIRREMTVRLTAQYERQVSALAVVIREDLDREGASVADRLAALTRSLQDDNRVRLALLQGAPAERAYLLNYAGQAMRVTGLSMLQLQDGAGRIVSSAHFRNEFDRLEPELPALLSAAPGGLALVRARTPDGPLLVLARVDSLRLGPQRFTLVGGVAIDRRFLARLARGNELVVSLISPSAEGVLSSDSALGGDNAWIVTLDSARRSAARERDFVVAETALPYIDAADGGGMRLTTARLLITHPLGALLTLRRSVDLWFLVALAVTAAGALSLAAWLSARLSRPLVELARRTSRVDLDRLDADFPTDRGDEIGALSRLLQAMTARLRASTARLREAERRATVGDIARQLNHDIKNGLTPIRNVLRHLDQVQRERPEQLATVFVERKGTLDSSIAYLDTLARNYARLTPRLDHRPCDVNAVVDEVIRTARGTTSAELRTHLVEGLPPVQCDAVVLRRIVENLVVNAIDALEARPGIVTVTTQLVDDTMVRLTVADTGRGMTKQELARAFDDFYSTKPDGTGLGLTIVRRLVMDLHGSLRVETEPGVGSRFMVELPGERASGVRASGVSNCLSGDLAASRPSGTSRGSS